MEIDIQDDFDLDKIASCGQCFRAGIFDNGLYRFITEDHVIYLRKTGPHRYDVSCSEGEWQKIWRTYFDLDRNYNSLRAAESQKHEFVHRAIEYGRGLRILRQDPWEMVITFIISQRKSIPAISKSVEALAAAYGHTITTEYEKIQTFPTPEEMRGASEEELKGCGLGYRVPYINDAVNRAASKALDLAAASYLDDERLFAELQKIYGVGKKVANCICLFGYGRTACVPVDVWISRAVQENCGGKNPFPLFEANAGIIQQYVFYYMKNQQGK